VNASSEVEQARALLEEYDIDFETRSADGPAVTLHWNGQTFTDIFRDCGLLGDGRPGSAGAPKDGSPAPR
jgi:hypothetical protein